RIQDVNGPAFKHHPAYDRSTVGLERRGSHALPMSRLEAVVGEVMVEAIPRDPDGGALGTTEPRRRTDERVQHSLQVESGAADDFQDIGGRRLLLQRLAQFVEQPRVL